MTETYTIKPLEWRDGYGHLAEWAKFADSPVGKVEVSWNVYENAWNWMIEGDFESSRGVTATLEAAKAAAEQHYRELMRMGLVEVGENDG